MYVIVGYYLKYSYSKIKDKLLILDLSLALKPSQDKSLVTNLGIIT
jgi:hypothetical protein